MSNRIQSTVYDLGNGAKIGVILFVMLLSCGFNVFSNNQAASQTTFATDSISTLPVTVVPEQSGDATVEPVSHRQSDTPSVTADRHRFIPDDMADEQMGFAAFDLDTIKTDPYAWVERKVAFNPSPTKAVWLSALFPGLGQIYNRRYWKLPLIAGGYLGLAYATSWNNSMLSDYTVAYADLLDSDPSTKSYMDFFPPSVTEDSLDKTWLQNILQSRKNYFRRNRDLCIICMVGVYLLAMVDAYVDASLSHFDITPDLSMDVAPALMNDGRNRLPSIGLQWAINF